MAGLWSTVSVARLVDSGWWSTNASSLVANTGCWSSDAEQIQKCCRQSAENKQKQAKCPTSLEPHQLLITPDLLFWILHVQNRGGTLFPVRE